MSRWFVDGVDAFVQENLVLLPQVFEAVILAGEYTPFNLLVPNHADVKVIVGMIDFADAMTRYHEYDLLAPWLFSCGGRADFVKALLTGYGYASTAQHQTLRQRAPGHRTFKSFPEGKMLVNWIKSLETSLGS